MRRIIILLVAMTLACQMQGQIVLYSPDFSVGNLYYRIIVPRLEVEVVTNPDGCVYYSGNIVVPDSVEHDGVVYKVTSIGDYVFTSASLSSISLPQGVRSIGINCFSSATIRGIFNLPDSLRIIKDEAFYNCKGITNIHIPALVETIGTRAFSPTTALKTITVDTSNQYFSALNGILYNKDTTVLLCCPSAKTGQLIIPEGVIEISNLAIECCKISSVVIPNTVKVIKNAAFSQCEILTSIRIPASVTYMEGGIVRGCPRLTNITIDSLNANYKSINNVIYSTDMDTLISYHLAKDTVIIPNSVKVIAMDAFAITTKLNSVVLPNGIKVLQDGAFQASTMRTINLPETLQEIGAYTFCDCSLLRNIDMPNSVTKMGEGAFYLSNIVSIKISDSLKVIPRLAFEYCSLLKSYTGGNLVERIEEYAFKGCKNLSNKFTFPPTLKVIGESAFSSSNIDEVEFTGIVDTIGLYSFENIRKMILINTTPPYASNSMESCDSVIIPCGATPNYLSDPNWSSYTFTEDCDGIEDIDPQSAVQVVAQHKAVDVYNAENYSVAIYDLMGRCHTAEPATGYNLRHYTLPSSGVYIVRVNGKGYKVVVQ